MEWKKTASMEYGKIVFHYMPCVCDVTKLRNAGLPMVRSQTD